MPTFKAGDSVIFAWCEGKQHDHLVGKKAQVLDVMKYGLKVTLYVLFENGEENEFFADRFELIGSEDRLLWKVKQMWERQPYMQRKEYAFHK